MLARELPPNTTSDVAAALWYPYMARPRERVMPWAERSLARFCELAADPSTGIALRDGFEKWPDASRPRPGAVPGERRARRDELPPGCADGFAMRLPVIEMPLYLPWLERRFAELGGLRTQRELRSLSEVDGAEVVVDCAGLGARELAGDSGVHPIRGQVVRVVDPEIGRFLIDDSEPDPIYVVPRSADCVVGGTAEVGSDDLCVDEETTRRILERATALEPRLAQARVIGACVGLRPGRSEVRLEGERAADGTLIVHDYGHGGTGVTLSWGCAEEVVRIVQAEGRRA